MDGKQMPLFSINLFSEFPRNSINMSFSRVRVSAGTTDQFMGGKSSVVTRYDFEIIVEKVGYEK